MCHRRDQRGRWVRGLARITAELTAGVVAPAPEIVIGGDRAGVLRACMDGCDSDICRQVHAIEFRRVRGGEPSTELTVLVPS